MCCPAWGCPNVGYDPLKCVVLSPEKVTVPPETSSPRKVAIKALQKWAALPSTTREMVKTVSDKKVLELIKAEYGNGRGGRDKASGFRSGMRKDMLSQEDEEYFEQASLEEWDAGIMDMLISLKADESDGVNCGITSDGKPEVAASASAPASASDVSDGGGGICSIA